MSLDEVERYYWNKYGITITYDSYRPKDRRRSSGYVIKVPTIHATEHGDEICFTDHDDYHVLYAADIVPYIKKHLDKEFLKQLKVLMAELKR